MKTTDTTGGGLVTFHTEAGSLPVSILCGCAYPRDSARVWGVRNGN